MGKIVKTFACLGLVVLLAGGALVGIGFANGKIKEDKIEEKVFTTEESFSNLKFDVDTSNIEFKVAEDNKTTITYGEKNYQIHNFEIKDDTLIVKEDDNTPWYERFFRFNWTSATMVVSLPKVTYDSLYIYGATGSLTYSGFDFTNTEVHISTGEVKISNSNVSNNMKIGVSTGSIELEEIHVSNDLTIAGSTGSINLNKVTGKNLNISNSTGDVLLKETVLDNVMSVKLSTGDIRLDRVDGKNISIITSTGSISGSFLTGKSFNCDSNNKANVPFTTGDPCYLKTSTGSINITIAD